MNKKLFFLIFGILFLFSLVSVSAVPPFQTGASDTGYQIKFPQIQTLTQNTNFTLNFHIFNISNGVPIDNSSTVCVLHFYGIQGNQEFEVNVSHSNSITVNNEWEILMLAGNISETGEYSYVIQCNSLTDNLGGFNAVGLLVTPTGEPIDGVQLASRIFLILLSILLVILIQRNSKKVNYDSWYAKLAKKYEKKNWIKFGLSALGFNLMKNSWIFSYLVGLLGLLILTDLTYFFNITSALEVMKIVFGIYTWSAIAVALIFFSQVQEWIVGWIEDLQNINWGMVK